MKRDFPGYRDAMAGRVSDEELGRIEQTAEPLTSGRFQFVLGEAVAGGRVVRCGRTVSLPTT